MELRHNDTIPAIIDDEEVTIYNWLNVRQTATVLPGSVEEYDPDVVGGDSGRKPRYVTEWAAEKAEGVLGIDLWSDEDITVVDPESDGVEVL